MSKFLGYLLLALLLIFGCLFVVSLFRGETMATIIVNLTTEHPIGARLEQTTEDGKVFVSWRGIDGKNIPSDGHLAEIVLKPSNISGCSGEYAATGIQMREFKPMTTSAMFGDKPVWEVIAIGAFDTNGCLMGIIWSDDFLENGVAIEPPSDFLTFWQSMECKVALFNTPEVPCNQTGYVPEPAAFWAWPYQPSTGVYIYKIGFQGAPWPYPLSDPAVTQADLQAIANVNPALNAYIKEFYFTELLLSTPIP